ncbi:MAG: hypothetical protein UU63_C0010G0003 [Candidatus Uhrbacteria bacterium GW2011_GWF2_41_430]|nr:MAG: hypothetical protein UU63_C0010G0003 [Candidatus Uhrbacteria bacterium GW2011_GWF2_41_430]
MTAHVRDGVVGVDVRRIPDPGVELEQVGRGAGDRGLALGGGDEAGAVPVNGLVQLRGVEQYHGVAVPPVGVDEGLEAGFIHLGRGVAGVIGVGVVGVGHEGREDAVHGLPPGACPAEPDRVGMPRQSRACA